LQTGGYELFQFGSGQTEQTDKSQRRLRMIFPESGRPCPQRQVAETCRRNKLKLI